MRLSIVALAASLSLLPVSVPGFTSGARAAAASSEPSAAATKPAKATVKKKPVAKAAKPTEEYLRAVPVK